MFAADAGVKWNGLAINAQFFMRWLDDFEADGPLPLWLNAELFHVSRAPYSGAFTPYTAGMKGWVPMLQTVLAF